MDIEETTRNKGTRKYFGHLKVTGFEDLQIYDNIHQGLLNLFTYSANEFPEGLRE